MLIEVEGAVSLQEREKRARAWNRVELSKISLLACFDFFFLLLLSDLNRNAIPPRESLKLFDSISVMRTCKVFFLEIESKCDDTRVSEVPCHVEGIIFASSKT